VWIIHTYATIARFVYSQANKSAGFVEVGPMPDKISRGINQNITDHPVPDWESGSPTAEGKFES
jgi:hypothetical protein